MPSLGTGHSFSRTSCFLAVMLSITNRHASQMPAASTVPTRTFSLNRTFQRLSSSMKSHAMQILFALT